MKLLYAAKIAAVKWVLTRYKKLRLILFYLVARSVLAERQRGALVNLNEKKENASDLRTQGKLLKTCEFWG